MKAHLYDMEVSDGMLDHLHGMNYSIKEVFVPKYKVAFNNKGFFFSCEESRNEKYEEIDIPDFLAVNIQQAIILSDVAKESINNFFNED